MAAPSLSSPCYCGGGGGWGVGGSRLSAGTGAGAREGTNDSAKAKGNMAAALPQIIPKLDHWQADNGEGENKPPLVEGKPPIPMSA